MTHRVTKLVATLQSTKVERTWDGGCRWGAQIGWRKEVLALGKAGASEIQVTGPSGRVLYWWTEKHGRIDK